MWRLVFCASKTRWIINYLEASWNHYPRRANHWTVFPWTSSQHCPSLRGLDPLWWWWIDSQSMLLSYQPPRIVRQRKRLDYSLRMWWNTGDNSKLSSVTGTLASQGSCGLNYSKSWGRSYTSLLAFTHRPMGKLSGWMLSWNLILGTSWVPNRRTGRTDLMCLSSLTTCRGASPREEVHLRWYWHSSPSLPMLFPQPTRERVLSHNVSI